MFFYAFFLCTKPKRVVHLFKTFYRNKLDEPHCPSMCLPYWTNEDFNTLHFKGRVFTHKFICIFCTTIDHIESYYAENISFRCTP